MKRRMKGKTINLGIIGKGNYKMAQVGMKAFGWSKKSIRPKEKSKLKLFK